VYSPPVKVPVCQALTQGALVLSSITPSARPPDPLTPTQAYLSGATVPEICMSGVGVDQVTCTAVSALTTPTVNSILTSIAIIGNSIIFLNLIYHISFLPARFAKDFVIGTERFPPSSAHVGCRHFTPPSRGRQLLASTTGASWLSEKMRFRAWS